MSKLMAMGMPIVMTITSQRWKENSHQSGGGGNNGEDRKSMVVAAITALMLHNFTQYAYEDI